MILKILLKSSSWQKEMEFEILPHMVKSFTDNSSIVYWDECKKNIEEIVHENVRELLRDEIKALTEALDENYMPDENCIRAVKFTLKEGEKEASVIKLIDVNRVSIYKKPTEYIMDEYITTYYLEYDQDIACMLTELFNIFEEKNKEDK